jgi:hypothetical protein
MGTVVRLVVALVLAVGGVVTVAGAAIAATPSITLETGPYQRDEVVGVLGSGCPNGSPVSFDVWDTAKPSSHVPLDSATTANSSGVFGYAIHLDDHFDAGAQVGFFASCTTTVSWSAGPGLVADPKYNWIAMPAPHVDIVAPPQLTAGTGQRVIVRTDSVLGGAALTLDGTALPLQPDSVYGWWHYELAGTLGVGSHVLQATWDPTAPDAPTVTDTQTVEVVRATPTLTLTANRVKVHLGHRIRLTITLSVPGAVTLLDGRKNLRQLTVPAGGALRLKVRLTGVRKHRLRVVFAGNDRTAGATSAVVRVRVRR